jgi:hypothetical protein
MAENKTYTVLTQLSKMASIENSFPIEGSAILTEETPKGGRKAANVVIAKANRLLVALLFIVSIVVHFVKNIYCCPLTLGLTLFRPMGCIPLSPFLNMQRRWHRRERFLFIINAIGLFVNRNSEHGAQNMGSSGAVLPSCELVCVRMYV